jgi:UDP-glucose-4-epimerase GalE
MTTQNQTVLVTGGAGYVGSHVAKALSDAGYLPVTYDNLSRGVADAVKWGPLIEHDLQDGPALRRTIEKYRPCGVIHLAAYAYVQESVEKPLMYFANNIGGSESLLSEMIGSAVSNIVFSSTCSLYGETDRPLLDETVLPNPVNPYAQTKWAVEQMLAAAGSAHDLRSVSLRYFNAAGADPDGEIGENHIPETHLIPLVLEVAAGMRPHIEIYGDDYPTADGTAVRDYIHVSDLADAHVLALKRLLKGGQSATLNLANGRGYSVREVVDVARQVTGHEIPAKMCPRRTGDPPELVGDSARAREKLNWRPLRSELATQIADAWQWMQKKNHAKKDS